MTQQQFIDYLAHIARKRDGNHLADSSVQKYGIQAINKIQRTLRSLFNDSFSLFDVDDIEELRRINDILRQQPEFLESDKTGNNMYSVGWHWYIKFAEGYDYLGMEKEVEKLDKPILFDSEVALATYHKKNITVQNRNRIMVQQLEKACNYHCNMDPSHTTFLVKDESHQYMEGHHIIPLKNEIDLKVGLDCPANILVLCPTCHRFFHYGTYQEREEKLKAIYDQRGERLLNSGITLDRNQFLDLANDRTKGTFTYTLD